jgi:hypothetical protein
MRGVTSQLKYYNNAWGALLMPDIFLNPYAQIN